MNSFGFPTDWIELTFVVVQAVAVSGAALAAWRGVTTWRHEMTARRRAELAEHTLATFFEARDIIAGARFPASFGGEGATRQRHPSETEDDAGYRDALYVPVERLNRQTEFWGKFEAARYPFMAVFGKEAAEPFVSVQRTKNRIISSAGMLIRNVGRADQDLERLEHQLDEWQSDIRLGTADDDALAREVDLAVAEIEQICGPSITGGAR